MGSRTTQWESDCAGNGVPFSNLFGQTELPVCSGRAFDSHRLQPLMLIDDRL